MVFRIFDNILATGVEALFGFSLIMLRKNEEKLLTMKFEEIVVFLNNKIFDTYKVGLMHHLFSAPLTFISLHLRARTARMTLTHSSKTP